MNKAHETIPSFMTTFGMTSTPFSTCLEILKMARDIATEMKIEASARCKPKMALVTSWYQSRGDVPHLGKS